MSRRYKSIVVRRGKKRALVAIGSKILIAVYYILKKHEEYKEFDSLKFDAKKKEYIRKYHLLKLKELGFTVELKEQVA